MNLKLYKVNNLIIYLSLVSLLSYRQIFIINIVRICLINIGNICYMYIMKGILKHNNTNY